jgi:MFS family permease
MSSHNLVVQSDWRLVKLTSGSEQISAAIGALIAGRLGDIIGRKRCVRIGAFIYFWTAFMQMFAPGFNTFVAGRTIQGLGVGFLSMTVPIIQTEIAAPHARGLMVGIEYTFLIAGYMLSCWVDYGFNFMLPSEISWQGPFIIQIALSFLLLVMSFYLPETPRWLAKVGFFKESLQTIADLHSNGDTEDESVQRVFLEIQEAVRFEETLGSAGWGEMFTVYRKRTIVGITAQAFAQLNGINIISFYLPSTLADAGFDTQKSLLYTGANAIPYTAATIATWWLADHWGRRPLLILGGVLMAVLLAIVCAFTEANMGVEMRANGMCEYRFRLDFTQNLTSSRTICFHHALQHRLRLYLGCVSFLHGERTTANIYSGPMPWLLPAEIFPLRSRSKGMALATVSCPVKRKGFEFSNNLTGIQLDFQLHYRHGFARRFRRYPRLLLPDHRWVLPVLRGSRVLLLRRDRRPYAGRDRCGVWRPSLRLRKRRGDDDSGPQGWFAP